MNTFRSIVAMVACGLLLGCAASPVPTPSHAPTSQPSSTMRAAVSPPPTQTVQPTATAQANPTAQPTSSVSAIDGAYVTNFTQEDLAGSPLLYDQSEVNDENWGTWTLTFDKGVVYYWQGNDLKQSGSDGRFSVDGDAVSMKFLRGDNTGETFAFRWTLDGTALKFRRDASIGIGPTPFLVST